MTRASTASTSSIPSAGSWGDISKLGEFILDQLGRDRPSETLLVHWVAHRLAEHMHTAETAEDSDERERARDAAALLIAELWQARGGWPYGWPPGSVQELVDAIRPSRPDIGEPSVALPPWLSSLNQLSALHGEETDVWLKAALLELGDDGMHRAGEVAPVETPEPEDLADIRWQLNQHDSAANWIAAHAREGEDPGRRADRARILERILQDISDRRSALIERALADARRGQRRKPAAPQARTATRRKRRAPKSS